MITKYKHLYWCEDACGKYSRPVIANGVYQAAKLFAKNYGYYTIDCFSKWIRRLPKNHQLVTDLFPSDSLVNDCGIVIIDPLALTGDPIELKIISMSKRHYGKSNNRIFYFKELKNRFVLEEKK